MAPTTPKAPGLAGAALTAIDLARQSAQTLKPVLTKSVASLSSARASMQGGLNNTRVSSAPSKSPSSISSKLGGLTAPSARLSTLAKLDGLRSRLGVSPGGSMRSGIADKAASALQARPAQAAQVTKSAEAAVKQADRGMAALKLVMENPRMAKYGPSAQVGVQIAMDGLAKMKGLALSTLNRLGSPASAAPSEHSAEPHSPAESAPSSPSSPPQAPPLPPRKDQSLAAHNRPDAQTQSHMANVGEELKQKFNQPGGFQFQRPTARPGPPALPARPEAKPAEAQAKPAEASPSGSQPARPSAAPPRPTAPKPVFKKPTLSRPSSPAPTTDADGPENPFSDHHEIPSGASTKTKPAVPEKPRDLSTEGGFTSMAAVREEIKEHGDKFNPANKKTAAGLADALKNKMAAEAKAKRPALTLDTSEATLSPASTAPGTPNLSPASSSKPTRPAAPLTPQSPTPASSAAAATTQDVAVPQSESPVNALQEATDLAASARPSPYPPVGEVKGTEAQLAEWKKEAKANAAELEAFSNELAGRDPAEITAEDQSKLQGLHDKHMGLMDKIKGAESQRLADEALKGNKMLSDMKQQNKDFKEFLDLIKDLSKSMNELLAAIGQGIKVAAQAPQG